MTNLPSHVLMYYNVQHATMSRECAHNANMRQNHGEGPTSTVLVPCALGASSHEAPKERWIVDVDQF
eukprot:UN4961